MLWTSPHGQTYTTYPGSRLLFPTLCRPTAPVAKVAAPHTDGAARTLAMPRRTNTRAENRTQAITDERTRNEAAIQAEAEQRARDRRQREDSENDDNDAYFPSRPRPPSDGYDPAPF